MMGSATVAPLDDSVPAPAPSNHVTIHLPADASAANGAAPALLAPPALTAVPTPANAAAFGVAPVADTPAAAAAPQEFVGGAAVAIAHGTPSLTGQSAPIIAAEGSTPRSAAEIAAAEAALSAYSVELHRQKKLLPVVPNLTVSFTDVTVSVEVPVADHGFATVGSRIWDTFTLAGFRGKNKTKMFEMISGATGVVRPGTMTLVLAPPGHGKSTLLKTIATRLTPASGAVRYNGLTKAEAEAAGFYPSKLVQYVDQVDVHNPLLTVQETFQFAVDNASVDASTLPELRADEATKAEQHKIHEQKANSMVNLLGLQECRDTILGNSLLRGVSGGQKKRVTLGECLLSEARVLCLDEVTNGLDSSTSVDIFRSLRTWCTVTGGSVVSVLQQPTPELFACFDDLILLRDGHVVYSGPSTKAIPYLESLGYYCPADSDLCDYMVEFLTQPRFVYQLQQQRAALVSPSKPLDSVINTPMDGADSVEKKAYGADGTIAASTKSSVTTPAGIELTTLKNSQSSPHADVVPFTTAELSQAFAVTSIAKDNAALISLTEQNAKVGGPEGVTKTVILNEYCKRLYGSPYAHSVWQHFKSSFWRQKELNARNKGLFWPRIIKAVILSLLLGSLFWNTGVTAFSQRIALILFGLSFVAFANSSELPIAVEAKRVLYKQSEAGLLPVSSYVISVVINSLPLGFWEPVVYSCIIYFMCSFTTDAGLFFIYVACQICSGVCMNVFYRMLAFVAPNEDLASALAGPTTGIFMLFGGFFITKNSVPDFMIWLYWLSPFSWSVRSLAVNEFRASRYVHYINPSTGVETDIGQLYLDTYEMSSGSEWVWNGPLFLLAYFFFFTAISVVVLTYVHYPLSRGTKRFAEEEHSHGSRASVAAVVDGHNNRASVAEKNGAAHEDGQHASAAASSMPFTPAVLSFKELHYTVVTDQGQKKKLLFNVSGYAKPKTLTALMGVSGAGKTTLMDVIAGRKTQGVIEGDILVNGKKTTPAKFARISGYVEQEDVHLPTATVRETMLFAAHLRLPEEVPTATKEQFVDEILSLLELSDIRDRLIGNAVIEGLSPGQLKRVTIGVELVANPAILFLDEPTTGLDSRSAYTVMRVVKKIAASGRSVVCTIHQPSAELFYMFDHLLLLAPGGVQTYFGSIGSHGTGLVKYFEELGAPRKPRRMNPATWMLEVIGAGTGANNAVAAIDIKEQSGKAVAAAEVPKSQDFGAAYLNSALYRNCTTVLGEIYAAAAGGANGNGAAPAEKVSRYATSVWTQFYYYLIRAVLSYWRNVPFIGNRLKVLTTLSVVFGLVYYKVGTDSQGGMLSKIGVIFISSSFSGVIHSASSITPMFDQRPVLYRERAANTYASIVYSVSVFLVELPCTALLNAIYQCMWYFMAGLELDATLWFKFYFANYMLSLCYVAMAHFLTAMLPNKLTAGLMQSMYFSMFLLFGSMLINGNAIPAGWKWMWHLTPLHHALESLAMPQFASLTAVPGDVISVVSGVDTIQMTKAAFASEYLAFPFGNYWTPLGYVAVYIVVVRILMCIAVEKVSFLKR